MSRTTLAMITAAALATTSLAMMIGRQYVLGPEIKAPAGPGTWKVTLLVTGKSMGTDARLATATPLSAGSQRVLSEDCHSSEFSAKPPDARHPDRSEVLWFERPGGKKGPFRVVYQFYCTVAGPEPGSRTTRLKTASEPPAPGEEIDSETRIESDHADIGALARSLAAGLNEPRDQFEAFYQHVSHQIRNEPATNRPGLTGLECLQSGGGDSAAKSRLLVALCRNRGIPARVVSGVTLRKGYEQKMHYWVEAWVHQHWHPACPFYQHFGRLPATFLVFRPGDLPPARGRNVRELDHAFLVERTEPEEDADTTPPLRHWLRKVSLRALPPPEQRLVEFLLLLPVAALIVCIFRNIIGLTSFGTFAPALLGLAFRDLHSWRGFVIFMSIVLLGWLMRRVLDRYHLLQVPRIAVLLSLVVIVLISAIVAANAKDYPATKYVSLFPIVILTGMIERFWTLEIEDGAASSFRTLFVTMLIAATISLALSMQGLVRHMFRFPETLGLIMALELLIGRYTGYRLTELFRFRDLLDPQLPTESLRVPAEEKETNDQ